MTHGPVTPTDWRNMITVLPGPTLHVWRDGAEFCNVPLSPAAALSLIGQITAALQMAKDGNA